MNEEEKIYHLLASHDENNVQLAFALAKGLKLPLTDYWQDLKNYYKVVYDYNENNESAFERMIRERSIYVSTLHRKPSMLRFLRWVIHVNRVHLHQIELEELPTYVATNPKLEELNISENHLHKLPSALANSPIKRLNVSTNPQLDLHQLWQIVRQMPHLKELKWLNNTIITFTPNGTLDYPYSGLFIHYHPQCLHYPEGLRTAFRDMTNLEQLQIDLRPLQERTYNPFRLPPFEHIPPRTQFFSGFFQYFSALKKVTFYGTVWDWDDTFEQLSQQIDTLETIDIYTEHNSCITLHLSVKEFKIHTFSSYYAKKKSMEQPPIALLQAARFFSKKIVTLYIETNIYLEKLPDEICHFSELETLRLNKLGLSILPHDWSNLQELRYVFLSHNPAVAWHKTIRHLASLRQLQILHLAHNQIQQLPISVVHWVNLEELDLSHNQLKAIPDWVKQLKNLKILRLNSNKIKFIPDWITQLPIEELYLSGNRIKAIDSTLEHFPSLRCLYLDSNLITHFPDNLYHIPQLETLCLANNPLEYISNAIIQAKSLEVLVLNACQLKELPSSFAKMQQLQRLFLSNNNFKTIPKEVRHLPNLERLGLAYNQLQSVDSVIHLPNLTHLNISGNPLVKLPNGIEKSTKLQSLKASHTKLERLPNLLHLEQLREVAFDYSNIQHLNDLPIVNSYMNISLRGIYLFDWKGLHEKIKTTANTIEVFWLKNRKFSIGDKLQLDFRNQQIKDWSTILTLVKNLPIRPTLYLQGNDIEFLGEEWLNCSYVNELFLEKNPNFDVKKSLPVFQTMKKLRYLSLDDNKKWWQKRLQAALGDKTTIRFRATT